MITLDQRGRRCPLPIIELARHVDDVGVGELIAIAADDPAARLDVPAWCRMRSQELVSAAENTYVVRRVS